MMNQLLLTPFIALAAAVPTQCTPTPPPERPAQVIWVGETFPTKFNAESGDTVNIIMNDDSEELDELNRCDDMGGRLERNPYTEVLICYDVDF